MIVTKTTIIPSLLSSLLFHPFSLLSLYRMRPLSSRLLRTKKTGRCSSRASPFFTSTPLIRQREGKMGKDGSTNFVRPTLWGSLILYGLLGGEVDE